MSEPAGKTLVIVESPAKAKTINSYLGRDYRVIASVGHVIDLPPRELGVDIEKGFKPSYHIMKGKEAVLKRLKEEAAKASSILLATDPDREGEAIAWLIAGRLKSPKKSIRRIEFNEITAAAVQNALQHPREIDLARVQSQQARRVMDRLVGYQVSPVLWRGIVKGLSAGRVQSVALRLICEREEEISTFVALEYWRLDVELQTAKGETFRARLVKIGSTVLQPGRNRISTRGEAERHAGQIRQSEFTVASVEKKKVEKKPPPPFITSTLQQDAARRFNMPTRQVMSIAQKLYEGIDLGPQGTVGLITYMRSDSTRIGEEALKAARTYITDSYGVDYLPAKAVQYAGKKSAQDAHEAIRPTHIGSDFEPRRLKRHLGADEFRIYELIWQRFIACQMKPAVAEKMTIDVAAGKYLFRAEGEVLLFRGFLQAYQLPGDDSLVAEDGEEGPQNLPRAIAAGDPLKLLDVLLKQLFTKPPPRYSESSLVKMLDKLAIGRPSTYSQIIATLFQREYVLKEDRWLIPTELGKTVAWFLIYHFDDIFNVRFTAEMEASLDRIESAGSSYRDTLEAFYGPFRLLLDKVEAQVLQVKHAVEKQKEQRCASCGGKMVLRWGKEGHFLGCSNYPQCSHTVAMAAVAEADSVKCRNCGSPLIERAGRFGNFLSCSRYPDCRYTRPMGIGVSCPRPECGGDLLERQSRKGTVFYGCSNYPQCKKVFWNRPVARACSGCGYALLEEVIGKDNVLSLICPECGQRQE